MKTLTTTRATAFGVLRLAVCLLLLAAGAATQSGKILGHDLRPAPVAASIAMPEDGTPLSESGAVRADGDALFVDSTTLAHDVTG